MTYDSTTEVQKILSLCSGYGGIERGIEQHTRLKTVAYVEIEAFAIANLANAMEAEKMDSAPIFTDVKTFDGMPFRNRVHGITGGYPCQPFSVAGLRKGKEDPRHLWPYIFKLIATIRPIWCLFENVPGHVNQGLEEVMQDLRNLGYAVEVGIFSAEEVGAPHQRKRIFIFAHSKSDEYGIELANANDRTRSAEFRQQQEKRPEILGRDELEAPKLANPDRDGHGAKHERFRKESSANEGTAQGKDGERVRTHIGKQSKTGEELGNPNNEGIRSEKDKGAKREPERGKSFVPSEELANANSSGGRENRQPTKPWQPTASPKQSSTNWPARPGQPQHDWEEPRQIEPRVGGPAYGNEHRSNLLRMLGNGVVPQTAAKAWYVLNLKMRKNFGI